jgi:hypothetical protein
MKLIESNPTQSFSKLEFMIGEFDNLFGRIVAFENGELKFHIDDSPAYHFMKMLKCKTSGIDNRLDHSFYFHELLINFTENFPVSKDFESQKKLDNLKFEFIKKIKDYFSVFLEISPKYIISPLEYYEILIKKEFPTSPINIVTPSGLRYSNGKILRFLNDGKIVIVPFINLLEIHEYMGLNQTLGTISIIEDNDYLPCREAIYFQRIYSRSNGVDKDYEYITSYHSFNADTLQLEVDGYCQRKEYREIGVY